MHSVTVYPNHLTNFYKEKTPLLAVSSPFPIYKVQNAFFLGVKATFRIKNICRKRRDNAEKDKNIHLFLETGKSAVEFWVDAIT